MDFAFMQEIITEQGHHNDSILQPLILCMLVGYHFIGAFSALLAIILLLRQTELVLVWMVAGCKVPPACALCPAVGGALKQTTCGKWVHGACALWMPGIGLPDGEQGVVEGLERVAKVGTAIEERHCPQKDAALLIAFMDLPCWPEPFALWITTSCS